MMTVTQRFRTNLPRLKPQARSVFLSLVERSPEVGGMGLSRSMAQSLGIGNISARVSELREAGAKIKSVPMTTRRGVRYVVA